MPPLVTRRLRASALRTGEAHLMCQAQPWGRRVGQSLPGSAVLGDSPPILRPAEDVFELRCDRPRASWLHRDDLCEQNRAEALVSVGAYLPLADVCSGVVWSFHPHRHLHGLTRFGRRHRRGL